MTWTNEQQQAITSRGGRILVSAAAGSGKTAVLVERILRLLCDTEQPTRADRLLVVTFTKAAAAEIQARIKTELERRIAQDPENTYLRRQALLLERAQISTVHAFCSALLRDHFSELGIASDFTLAEDSAALELQNRALETAMGLLYADPDSGIASLCDLFGKSRTDNDTAELIRNVCKFEADLAFPLRWEQDVLNDLSGAVPFNETRAGATLFAEAKLLLSSARDMAGEALERCSDIPELEKAYAPALRADFTYIQAMLARVERGQWDGCCDLAADYRPESLGRVRGKLPEAAPVKLLRNNIKSILSALSGDCFFAREEQYRADCAALLEPHRILFHAVAVYARELEKIKLEKRLFEFSDLERFAVRLLCDGEGNPTETAAAVAEQYDQILVDEYQDTNEVQDLIFRCVSRNEKNLFFVGDLKQSIYAFRRADPEIFVRRRDTCYADETGLYPKKIALDTNFRSTPSVIDAINAVFTPIMTARTGGTDYAKPGEALAADPAAVPDNRCGMELHLIEKGKNAEAKQIAATIARMLREGYPVNDRGTTRPCRESDFCILLRSPKSRAKNYAAALNAAGVRCAADIDDNLFLRSEIAVLLSLLQVIDNPCLDIPVAAVLLSPLFGFSPDDLVALRQRNRTAGLYSLLQTDNSARAADFLRVIQSLRNCRNALPIGELVQLCIDTLNAEVLLCAGDSYLQSRAALRMFIDFADDYARRSAGGLGAFLRACSAAAKGKRGFRHEFSRPDDAVCLMSVHRSKGLEWPVVFMANANYPFNLKDTYEPVMLYDAAGGAGARLRTAEGTAFYGRRTLAYAALSRIKTNKIKAEEMRILYVALTRARQKIVITAAIEHPETQLDKWSAWASCATEYNVGARHHCLDWIGIAYARSLPDPLRANTKPSPIQLVLPAEILSLESSPDRDSRAEPQPDPARVAAINRRAAFIHPRAALQAIPGKLSVTDLVKDHRAATLYRPAFARRTELSAAERGSALHLFMQLADYRLAARDIAAELNRLMDGQYLDEALARGTDLNKLSAFFDSAIGKQISDPSARLLREYAFIDAVDAAEIFEVPADCAAQKIMVQGIADCILLEDDGAILIDYKSDRVDNGEILAERYGDQLLRYKAALDRRLPVPVKQCLIYSFELGRTVEIR